jgi:hypothetical protein
LALDSAYRPENKGRTGSGHRTSPVGFKPIITSTECEGSKKASHERHAGRHPDSEHPNDRAHKENTGKDRTEKWMTEETLPDRQEKCLPWSVH